MTISALSINLLGEIAFAFCMFHFEGEVKGESKSRIADGRNTFILRYSRGESLRGGAKPTGFSQWDVQSPLRRVVDEQSHLDFCSAIYRLIVSDETCPAVEQK